MTKILSDKDFILKKETTQFLIRKKNEAMKIATDKYNYCSSIINPFSHAKVLMSKVENYLKEDNYFAAKTALDILG
jgi:hypothetical protein